MPARCSDSFILRTFPFGEADLIVSFFTRDQGKLRGAAHRARRPKSRFGSGLERLSHGRIAYLQRENRELVTIVGCELIDSTFELERHYGTSVALDFLAEVSDQMLPAAEVNERHFRLLMAVTQHLRQKPDDVWSAVLYFSLWAVRLAGFLPDLQLAQESLEIAEEMLRTPISALARRDWSKRTAADLRRFLVRQIEEHVERRLLTAPMLEAL